MTRRLWLLTVVLLAGTTLSGAAHKKGRPEGLRYEGQGRKPATHTVAIEGMQFTPAMVTARPGDTVVWVNKDIVAHTATSSPDGFNSRAIPPGKSWKLTFKTKGSSPYVCTYHPTMKGVIRVE